MKRDSKEMISGKKSGIKTAVLILAVLMTAGAVFTGAAVATQENGILPDWSDRVPSTLFYYEKVTGLNGTYSNMKETITLNGMDVLDTVSSLPEGIYINGINHTGQPAQIQLKKLDAEITMYVHDANDNIIYSKLSRNNLDIQKIVKGIHSPSAAIFNIRRNCTNPLLPSEFLCYIVRCK